MIDHKPLSSNESVMEAFLYWSLQTYSKSLIAKAGEWSITLRE